MFVHLHVHSHYSLLDATCKIGDLIRACKSHGMPAIALTDHGNLFGAIEFYTEACEQGVKPLVGCEVYVAPGSRRDRERGEDGDSFYHLVLLAKDLAGYRNLVKLVSNAYLEGFYYKPRIDKELLSEHREGLIGLSACLRSEPLRHFLRGREDEAEHAVFELAEILGRENFYLELQDHSIPEQKEANAWLPEVAKRAGLPLVATNDIHYLDRADALAHDVLLCVGTGKTLSDEKRKKYSSEEFYFKSRDEMARLFPENADAIERTGEVADRCNLILPFDEYHFPPFQSDLSDDNAALFRQLCREGIEKRYGKRAASPEVKERLAHELGVIEKQGFVNYFLIVWDFIRFARERSIPVGPGRGSAAGSIAAYGLGITDIDPLRYDLLFERFLNPGRNEPPDIDIDFCERQRGEVITYVKEKYGSENVCQIITFGKLKARAAVRDVGRVLEIPLPQVDTLAKMIPENLGLRAALEQEPELADLYKGDEKVKK
ncbi:MAG: DNA polymerase III subunit alpha, partial [Planctomycetota bacterium]